MLNTSNRDLVRLKFITRLSHEQIARALSISKGVAKYAARPALRYRFA